MALTVCRKCKHQVVSNAKTCPNCGIKTPGARWYYLALTLAFLGITIWLLNSSESTNTAEPANTISKSEYGEKWPLTVDQVELACEPPTLITVKANGVTYALNGSARTHAKRYGWEDFEQIWRTDPASEGTGTSWKIPPTGLIAKGMELCKQS